MGIVTKNANEQTIWKYLFNEFGNAYGVAGLIGNLYAESALRPDNLQNSYEKKLGYTDAEYIKAVDNGSYTNFVKDSAGFGLAQWTYWSRKERFLNFAKGKGKSIGDLTVQLEFLVYELKNSYSAVYNTIKTAKSVQEASNAVLLKFERPADMSVANQNRRASFGQAYYDEYAKTEVKTEIVEDKPTYKVGDVVIYNGTAHYSSANAATAKTCTRGKAKITRIYQLGKSKHPYHLIAEKGGGSNVYGWVDVGSFQKA